jgi:hypothetical protein
LLGRRKPQLASKIRKYQNETDINTPNYVQGYTDLVRDHYVSFMAFFFKRGFAAFGMFALRSIILFISSTAPVFTKPSCCIDVSVSLM